MYIMWTQFIVIFSPKANELILIQFTMLSLVGHTESEMLDYVSLYKRLKKDKPWLIIDKWKSINEFY